MSSNVFEQRLELDQGVGYANRVFGYDYDNSNFITWKLVDGKIAIHSIEHDDQETEHGSIADTRTLANRFLADENTGAYRTLLRSIRNALLGR